MASYDAEMRVLLVRAGQLQLPIVFKSVTVILNFDFKDAQRCPKKRRNFEFTRIFFYLKNRFEIVRFLFRFCKKLVTCNFEKISSYSFEGFGGRAKAFLPETMKINLFPCLLYFYSKENPWGRVFQGKVLAHLRIESNY